MNRGEILAMALVADVAVELVDHIFFKKKEEPRTAPLPEALGEETICFFTPDSLASEVLN